MWVHNGKNVEAYSGFLASRWLLQSWCMREQVSVKDRSKSRLKQGNSQAKA